MKHGSLRSTIKSCLPLLILAALCAATVTLVRASVPLQGGLGMATGGLVTTLFIEPINYQSSGSYYDQNNELRYANYVFHHGVDVSGGCVAGVYPVYAAAAGTVAVAQYINDGYGTQVIIDHGYNIGGNGRYTYTFYAHMGNRTTGARYINVSPGQYVRAGDIIGYQGNDGSVYGSCSPNPGTHLDWEIRLADRSLAYDTRMRYSATAASQNFYTDRQLTYGDPYPVTRVDPGPFWNGGLPTSTPTPPPNSCGMNFSDLLPDHWAYPHVAYLYCRSIITGYSDGTFRPGNPTTRAQFTKMIALGFNWTLYNPYFNTYADVLSSNTFYQHIESATLRGIISGYQCGSPGEACDSQRRPYFRWGNSVTRAQATKMLVLARNWSVLNPSTPTFSDVPRTHWAYGYIETAASRGIVGGSGNGLFYPETTVTRAQLAKMLALTLQQ